MGSQALLGVLEGALEGRGGAHLDQLHDTALVGGEAGGLTNDFANEFDPGGELDVLNHARFRVSILRTIGEGFRQMDESFIKSKVFKPN